MFNKTMMIDEVNMRIRGIEGLLNKYDQQLKVANNLNIVFKVKKLNRDLYILKSELTKIEEGGLMEDVCLPPMRTNKFCDWPIYVATNRSRKLNQQLVYNYTPQVVKRSCRSVKSFNGLDFTIIYRLDSKNRIVDVLDIYLKGDSDEKC